MSFKSCVVSLGLNGKIPARELRDEAAPHEAAGMSPEAALARAVQDKLQMALMEERTIVRTVRAAWEAKGGAKKAPAAAPQPQLTEQYVRSKVLSTLDPANYGGTLTLDRIAGIIGNPDKPGSTLDESTVKSMVGTLIAEGLVENIGTAKKPRYQLLNTGEKQDPLAGQRDRASWIPADDLKKYTTKEAEAEWDKARDGFKRTIMGRIDRKSTDPLATVSWADMKPADRKLVHAGLNEDFFTGSWYTDKSGARVDRFTMPKSEKSAAQVADEAGAQRWAAMQPNERESLLYENGIGKDAAQGKFAAWDKLGPPLRERLVAGWQTKETPAQPAQVQADKHVPAADDLPVATNENPPAGDKFANNKIFTSEAVEKARRLLRSKLGQLNSGIDPELMQAGIMLAGGHIEAGARSFIAFSKAMIEDIGENIRPFLRSFYEGVRFYPGIDGKGMTSSAEIDAILAAEATPAPAPLAKVIGTTPKAAKTAKAAPGNATLRLDYGIEHIDGYATTDEFPAGPAGDYPSGGVEDAFLKNAQKYLKDVTGMLLDAGWTNATGRDRKAMKPVSVNEGGPAVAGDASLVMFNDAIGKGIYVHIGESALRGTVPTSNSGIGVMMRVTDAADPFGGRENLWMDPSLTARDLAEHITKEVGKFDARSKSATLDTNVSKEEKNGLSDTGSESAAALGAVATEQGSGTGSDGRAGRSDAGGRTAGTGGNQDVDGSGSEGARSGGSGIEAVHPADAGTGAGRLGSPRAGRKGKPVSGNDGGPRVSAAPVATPAAPNIPATNFRITDGLRLGQGGEVEKFNDNLAAIRTLKAIEGESRRATSAEQSTLARYVGWGGLANAFPSPESGNFKDAWAKRGPELAELLSPKEYALARRSTLDSHYTSQTVVTGMWDLARHLGYKGGLALESSMGAGNFIGLMPNELANNTKFVGVEYDSLTARIAALLYPRETVLNSGFQSVPLTDGSFDLSIGNPPFGEQSLRFQFKPELNGHSIHNQFFLASLDAVKPGGLQVQVVSRYLLDKVDKSSRIMLAKKARLLGAIRLPDTAFKENARTSVVTDIVVLQRLTATEEAEMADAFDAASAKPGRGNDEIERQRLAALVPDWINTAPVRDPLGGEAMPVSRYFSNNPHMILGTLERSGSMAHGNDITVRMDKADDLGARLAGAISSLPKNVMVHDQTAIDASIARHKDMSDSLRIALAGHENGSIKLEAGGVLEQVIERETPEGAYELAKRSLTAASPWSDQLYMNSAGKWYTIEPVLGENGKPVKVMKGDKATNLNVYDRKVFENESDIPASMLLGEGRFDRLKKLVNVRDLLKEQLSMEAESAPDSQIESNRAALAGAYNDFVKAHGLVSEPANSSLVGNMPDGALVQALEFSYRPAITAARALRLKEKVRPASAVPAPILSKRVIMPYEAPTTAASMPDAIAINMAESGRVDLDRVGSLLGMTEQQIEQQMNDDPHPLLFKDPETNKWETRNEYLTGQVTRKLNAAREARMSKNVMALEEVQPEPWGAESVTALLGSAWVPPKTYADFTQHITGTPARVGFSAITNSYNVNVGDEVVRAQEEEWGSPGYSAAALISDLLNSSQIKVTYRDQDGKTHIDAEKTALALLKAKAITGEWNDWVYKDGERRNELVQIFNDKFNTRIARQHDGSHLVLPGKVPDQVIGMRRHQKNAIWRGISESFGLLDHAVGAGKTFTAIARAMERRRMGLSQKPAIIVPNHMVEQFTSDVYRLYPGAKVLAAGKKDFEKSRRRKLFAKIATGDFDIVIIPHSSFGFIGISPETEARYLQTELDAAQQAVEDAQEEAESNGETGFRKPFGVKEAERLVDKITARMEKVAGDKNKDQLLTFEQMGIDDLTVDEAHEFKNLYYSSRLTGVKGMGNKTGSQKAFDLYNKVRVLREKKGGVLFMTGTPISNSAVEMYNMMRYLAADELREMGLEHFDAWRAQFVSTDAGWEPNETGRLKEVNRLGRTWSNMRSLMDLYYSFTDAVDNDDIKKAYAEDNHGEQFPIPRVTGGDRQSVVIQPTKAQLGLLGDVLQGFDDLPGIKDPFERNKQRLRLMDRARKVSLDVRAADPSSKSNEKGGKLDVLADNVKRIYDQWDADRGTQLVFLDRSVPKAKGDDTILKEYDGLLAAQRKAFDNEDEGEQRRTAEKLERFDPNEMEELRNAQAGGWNAYQQIKDNLVARGIPESEIRFVQEANNDAQKKAMFDSVNDGTVRVLIGSTPRMGAGTNVQQRLVGLHHADVTWKPSDIEQREGRIIRQGNLLLTKYGIDKFEVQILAYATERTIDAKMWSLNASKLKTINAIRKYDGAFSMDFEDEDSVSMAELAALASGDPLLLERVKLMSEIDKLELLKRQHARKQWGITSQIEDAEASIRNLPDRITSNESDLEAVQAGVEARNAAATGRSVKIEGTVYTSGAEARKAVNDAVKAQQGGDSTKKLSVSIGDRRLTSFDGAMAAVGSSMGDESTFSMRIGDATHIARTDAARAAAQIATQQSENLDAGGSTSFEIGSFLGLPLQATIERFDNGHYQTSLAVLREDGTTLASGETKWRENPDYTTTAMRTAVEDLEKTLNPESLKYAVTSLQRRLASAYEALPGLREKKGGPFPQLGELTAKNARLEDVIRQLSTGPSTAARKVVARMNPMRNVDGSFRRQAPEHAVYSTTGSVALPADKMLSVEAITNEIQSRIGNFAHQPTIQIHDTAEGVLPDATRNDRVAGAVYQGTIHLFRDSLRDIEAVRKTLFHELLHYGVRRFMSEDQYISQMNSLYTSDASAKGYADWWMKSPEGQRTIQAYGDAHARAVGVDEFLAYLAEPNAGIYQNNTLAQRALRTVLKWLGKLAATMRMPKLAASIYGRKNQEARALIVDLFHRIETDKPPADPWSPGANPNFRIEERRKDDRTIEVAGQRRPISNNKGTRIAGTFAEQKAFWDWFGNSIVTDESGRPQVMYHASNRDFSTFNRMASTEWRRPSMDTVGSWFSDNPGEGGAAMYAQGEGAAVYPTYLSIKRPKVYDTFTDFLRDMHEGEGRPFVEGGTPGLGSTEGLRDKLKAQGYDGIAFTKTNSQELLDEAAEYRDAIARAKEGEYSALKSERPTYTAMRERLEDKYKQLRAEQSLYNGSTEFDKQYVWVAFDPEQIKSAIGNNGEFDRSVPDIRFRRDIGGALESAANTIANVRLPADYLVGDLFNRSGKVSWWHKTVGTMDNLARRSPAFSKVYDAVQSFLGDVSRYAVVAADMAPTLLPKLEDISDVIGKNRKKPLTAQDTKAIGAPIFEGTLVWARDANGKPVKVKELEEQADQMTTEQKAQILLQKGIIDDDQNAAWLGSPLDYYDSTIERKFAETQLKAGVVWSDAELRSMFDLNDSQVALYHEFRNASDRSLTNLSISEMVKLGGADAAGQMEAAVATGDLTQAAALLRDHFITMARENPEQSDMHLDTARQIMNVADKGQDLMDRGYAPLTRFGKYTVYVQEDNEQVYFGMFESQFEASRMARQMEAQHPMAQVQHGTVSEETYKLFAGVSPETIELFGSMVGLDSQADAASTEVYQAYLKLAKNNRSSMKRLIQRKGIAGFSEDAGRVLAGFIYSNARLTAGNAHLGEIDKAVTEIPKQQGELADAAMELRNFIKNPEGGGNKLGGLMFAQFLGGSVASALVNLTQPFTMTLPFLSQWGGIGKAGKHLAAAVRDASKDVTGDAALDAALKWASDEGIVAPQEIHYLQAQAAGKGALRSGDGTKAGNTRAALNNTMAKVAVGWGKLFAMAEVANRRVTFIAAYRTAVEQGIHDPSRFAQEAVTQTQGTYNGGNKPKWARGAIGGLAMTFKQYSIAYIELLSRMAFAGEPGSKERAAGQRAALYMVAVLFLMGGADGLPFEQDLEDALDGIMQRLGYNFSSKRSKQAFLTDVLGQGGADFALKGISSMPGMPIDVSGRFGMGNLIPATGLLTKKESYTRDIGELAGPAGDVATRAFSATGKLLGGDIAGAAMDMSPVSVRNVAKGVDMATSGAYKDARGYKINDVTPLEAVLKIAGFQPNSTADIQDAKGQTLGMISQTRMRSKEISERWAQGIANGDTEMVQEARDMRDDWNLKNPETRITVDMPALIKRVKSMRQDAINRTTMTAPKALKVAVRTELAQHRD